MEDIVHYLHHNRPLVNMPDLQFTGRSLFAVSAINEEKQHSGDIQSKVLIILKFFKGHESSDQGECCLKAVFVHLSKLNKITLENKQS